MIRSDWRKSRVATRCDVLRRVAMVFLLCLADASAEIAFWCHPFGVVMIFCQCRRSLSSAGPGVFHSPITKHLWETRLPVVGTESPTSVVDKPPSASMVDVVYDFSSNETLREQYINPWGHLRHSMILEDIDALAGNVAALHADDDDDKTAPHKLVTASVDKVHFRWRVRPDRDLRLRGVASWVGRSSMEVRMSLETLGDDGEPMYGEFFAWMLTSALRRHRDCVEMASRLR